MHLCSGMQKGQADACPLVVLPCVGKRPCWGRSPGFSRVALSYLRVPFTGTVAPGPSASPPGGGRHGTDFLEIARGPRRRGLSVLPGFLWDALGCVSSGNAPAPVRGGGSPAWSQRGPVWSFRSGTVASTAPVSLRGKCWSARGSKCCAFPAASHLPGGGSGSGMVRTADAAPVPGPGPRLHRRGLQRFRRGPVLVRRWQCVARFPVRASPAVRGPTG